MKRFIPFYLICLFHIILGTTIYAQSDDATVQLEVIISDVRPHEEPRGFFIQESDTIRFVQIISTTLETPGTRIFNTERDQRLSLENLQVGTRVSVTGTVSGTTLLATEIVVLEAVQHIWFDGVVIDIQREGPHQGQISLLEFGERIDKRARIFIEGEDFGANLNAISDLLNRTTEPVVVKLSERNAFEQNWLFGRVDVTVGTSHPMRAEINDTITFQLPSDPNEAVYISEHENALREIPTTIPVDDRTIIRSEAQEGAEISFDDIPLFARVTVNASLSGTELISADINVANIPREVRQTFNVDGIDPVSRVVGLGVGETIQMTSNAQLFDRESNPIGPREFEEQQWEEPKAVAVIDLDPTTQKGTTARLVEWQSNLSVNTNQVLMGAIGDIHRGIWIDTHNLIIGTRSLSGVLTPDTVIRLPDGTPISRAQLDWGAQFEVGGFVARDELIVREMIFQNVVKTFDLNTTLREFKAEHQWMSFEPSAPFRASENITVVDHFGDPITLSLLSDLLNQLDLQLRLSFTTDTDESRLVSRIEAFRPDDDVQVQLGQEVLQGAYIRAFDQPALIFSQSIENAHFNRDLEVYDTFGSRVDLRVLAPRLPVRVQGIVLLKQHNNQTERIARVHRIDIMGSERVTYRGTLQHIDNNQLTFQTPESFIITEHTDLREETGLQTDFLTLSGRIRSEGNLRIHLGANFNTSESPEVWWARILRSEESEPSFLSEHERIVTIVSADENRRTITPQPIPDIQITPETQIVNLSGDPLSQENLVRDARVVVQTEMQNGILVAIEIRIESQPKQFTLTADLQHIDLQNRVIQFASPDEIVISRDAHILAGSGKEIDLSELISLLRNLDPRLLRITYSPDSDSDTPVATQIEIVHPETEILLETNQILIVVEDPGGQIHIADRRIHPSALPSMVVMQDAEITDQAGQTITLDSLPNRIRVHLTGHDTHDRLVVSALQVLGHIEETGEGIIASVDVANRIITPAPEPSQSIHRRGNFVDATGQRVTLSDFANAIAQNPDFVLMVFNDAFSDGIQNMRLVNPRNVSDAVSDVEFYRANEITIDDDNALLIFEAHPPVHVEEGAPITGPNGETWALADLQEGQRIFVRGYSLNENDFVVTAIFVRQQINTIHIQPEIFSADGDGIENDVRLTIVDQNENPITESLRLQVNYNGPEEIQTGHIIHNLPPGPHLLGVSLPERAGLSDRIRVFISAQGTAFRITSVSPQANAINVATTTDLTITFNEPLHQIGDYLAIEGTLIPEPISEGNDPELHDDGRTLILRDMQLVENTDYTMVIFSATSSSGNSLGRTYRSRFSTGSDLTQPGGLSGVITLSENIRFIGTAHLFDANKEPVADMQLSESGAFEFSDINAGTYHLYLNISTEDGRMVRTFYDADNNNIPDDIILSQGEIQNNLNFALDLPPVTDPDTSGSNTNAVIALDLDTREGNQNQLRVEASRNNDVRIAVYANNVSDLIGYEVTLNYDSEALAFQSISSENNGEQSLLKQNGGLAVYLPPVVTREHVTLTSGILGVTDAQAVSESGLLGVFHFRIRSTNFTGTAVEIPRVVLQSHNTSDVIASSLIAEIVPLQSRLVMRIKHTPSEESFNGYHPSLVKVEIVDALGVPIEDGTLVNFAVKSGDGSFNDPSVRTQNGLATSQLKGTDIQHIAITAGGVTEEMRIQLQPFDDTDPTPGTSAPIVLDLNTALGDQGQRSLATPNAGDTFIIDVVATQDALGMAGYQVVLEYDATHFNFEQFNVTGIFAGASPITIPETGRVSINVAFLGSGPTTESTGSIGQATFRVADGFQAPSVIALSSATLSTGTNEEILELGTGSRIAIGINATSDTSSDFDGDGEIGFTDFIMFAQAFGTQSSDGKYDARYDLDGNGDVGFTDFITFAQAFGQPAGKTTRASKVVEQNMNQHAQIHLQALPTHTPEEIELVVSLSNMDQVQGYGLQIAYNPATFSFLGASNAHPSQFAEDQNIALISEHQSGTIQISDLLQNTLSTEMNLAHLRFRVLDPTAESSIEIAQALVSAPSGQITSLGVTQTQVRAIPTGFALNQNHPNPFNPDTVVPFSLPKSGEIHLAIYNTLGQEIRLLASGMREAGFHRVVWDGKNQNGQTLASGIYFVRLQAGSFSSVRKMMLIK